MDRGEIEFSRKVIDELVNVITDAKFVGESSTRGLKPLTIFFEDDLILVTNMTMRLPKLTVEVLSPFPYTDNKVVAWNYNCNYVNESATPNISGIGGMTRSGRCYVPTTIEMAPPESVKRLPKQKEPEVTPDVIKEPITEKKASKFLKFIKHSEYSVVEQLNKLLAHISLLGLLLNSEPHRNVRFRSCSRRKNI